MFEFIHHILGSLLVFLALIFTSSGYSQSLSSLSRALFGQELFGAKVIDPKISYRVSKIEFSKNSQREGLTLAERRDRTRFLDGTMLKVKSTDVDGQTRVRKISKLLDTAESLEIRAHLKVKNIQLEYSNDQASQVNFLLAYPNSKVSRGYGPEAKANFVQSIEMKSKQVKDGIHLILDFDNTYTSQREIRSANWKGFLLGETTLKRRYECSYSIDKTTKKLDIVSYGACLLNLKIVLPKQFKNKPVIFNGEMVVDSEESQIDQDIIEYTVEKYTENFEFMSAVEYLKKVFKSHSAPKERLSNESFFKVLTKLQYSTYILMVIRSIGRNGDRSLCPQQIAQVQSPKDKNLIHAFLKRLRFLDPGVEIEDSRTIHIVAQEILNSCNGHAPILDPYFNHSS